MQVSSGTRMHDWTRQQKTGFIGRLLASGAMG
jgi:hypothetical protein